MNGLRDATIPSFLPPKTVRAFLDGKRQIATIKSDPHGIDYMTDVVEAYTIAAHGEYKLAALRPRTLSAPSDFLTDPARLRMAIDPLRRLFATTGDDDADEGGLYAVLNTCMILSSRAHDLPRGKEGILRIIREGGVKVFRDHASAYQIQRASALNDDPIRTKFAEEGSGGAQILANAATHLDKAEKDVRDAEKTGIHNYSPYTPMATAPAPRSAGRSQQDQTQQQRQQYDPASNPNGHGGLSSLHGVWISADKKTILFGNEQVAQADGKAFPTLSCYAAMAKRGEDDEGSMRNPYCVHAEGKCPISHDRVNADFLKAKLTYSSARNTDRTSFKLLMAPAKRPRPDSGNRGSGNSGGRPGNGRPGPSGPNAGKRRSPSFRAGSKA